MRLPNDQALLEVDAVFLGPRGTTLPWVARYASYCVGAVVVVVVLTLERRVGIRMSITSFAWSVMVTVGLTTAIMRRVDYERPVRTVLVTFWREVSAPRDPRPQSCTFKPPRLS